MAKDKIIDIDGLGFDLDAIKERDNFNTPFGAVEWDPILLVFIILSLALYSAVFQINMDPQDKYLLVNNTFFEDRE